MHGEQRNLVGAPKEYICRLDVDTLRCDLSHPVKTKPATDNRLLRFCLKNENAKILVRYPRGHTRDHLFFKAFSQHAEILFSETFDITREQLNELLYSLYYHSSKLSTDEKIFDKCVKTWDDKGQITIFVFRLYTNCPCLPPEFTSGNQETYRNRYTEEVEIEHLKKMKRDIRDVMGTMHCIHTSDDHEETMDFATCIFNDSFLA